jgi:LAO/AO transport system kinase
MDSSTANTLHAPNSGASTASPHPLAERLLHGDLRALARAISLVENDAPEAQTILSACFPHTGRALRIGITGSPGAGKSTLVDRLARHFRQASRSVGVLAIDPSSPFTGGAILGDRIRFQQFHSDPGFYARSMATRGALGGLALATSDAALLLEASGKDVILIETVGVGQDEIEIARLADIVLVVLVPGMGDDVQSLKAGVMEIADIFVINKSDRDGADRVEQEIRSLQSLVAHHEPQGHSWTPPVAKTVATTGHGIPELAASLASLQTWLEQDNRLAARRARNWQRRLDAMLRAELMRRARLSGLSPAQLASYATRIAARDEDPWQLVARLASNLLAEKPAGETP